MLRVQDHESAANVSSPCAMVVHFHFCKAGGTALRLLMQHALGTVRKRDEFNVLQWSVPQARQMEPIVYYEQHGGNFPRMLGQVQALKTALRLQHSKCTVTTMAVVREPAEQLVSAYQYWGWNGSLVAHAAAGGPEYHADHGSLSCLGMPNARTLKRVGGPCFLQPLGTCTDACAKRLERNLGAFLKEVDVVIPLPEWNVGALYLASQLGLQTLGGVDSVVNAGVSAGARCRRMLASESWAALRGTRARRSRTEKVASMRPYVPCSARLYARWAASGLAWSREPDLLRRLEYYCASLDSLESVGRKAE